MNRSQLEGKAHMKNFLAFGVVLLATSAFAVGADLTGEWTISQSVAGNDSQQPCKFVQTGTKLTGTCKGAAGEVEITGTVEGNKATWKFDSEYQGTPLTVRYTATLDGTNKISGSVDVDPFGVSGEFTATPAKPDKK
jgi:hypothetical protein